MEVSSLRSSVLFTCQELSLFDRAGFVRRYIYQVGPHDLEYLDRATPRPVTSEAPIVKNEATPRNGRKKQSSQQYLSTRSNSF